MKVQAIVALLSSSALLASAAPPAGIPRDLSTYDFADYVQHFSKGYNENSAEWNRHEASFHKNVRILICVCVVLYLVCLSIFLSV